MSKTQETARPQRLWGQSAMLAITVAVLEATACGGSPTEPTRGRSVTPTEHLNELLRLMEAEAANARRVDWAQARTAVFAAAGDAQSISDTYPAIAVALNLLDDFESVYAEPMDAWLGRLPNPRVNPD